MNNYTCVKCGSVSVIPSHEAELQDMPCGCGTDKVKFKLGIHKIESPAKQNVVEVPTVPPPAAPAKPAAPKIFNPSATVGTIKKTK